MTASEILADLVIGVFITELGIKDTLEISFGTMIFASLLYMFPILSLPLWYAVILFLLKFAHTCAFATTFYGTSALFREDLTAIIFALCNLVARSLTIFAPLIANTDGSQPMFWFLIFSIIGIVVTSFIQDKSKSASTHEG